VLERSALLHLEGARRRPTAGIAVVAVFAVALCGALLLVGQVKPVSLEQASHGGEARQTELANLLTAPLENVATGLGHVIRSSLAGGVASWASGDGGEQRMPTVDDYQCYFKSDSFLDLMTDCCKTIYVSPHASSRLPLEFALGPAVKPAEKGFPYGTRFRYLVGKGNQFMFNGATQGTLDFINLYFGFEIEAIPVTSQFRKKVHAFELGEANPSKEFVAFVSELPEVLPDYEGMLAVNVASLPPSSTVLYNNYPRDPVGSPAVILKYCEGTDELGKLNGGLPMKIQPADCAAVLEEYNVICTCGEILIIGWTWPGADKNVWEHSLVSLDAKAVDSCETPAELVPMRERPAESVPMRERPEESVPMPTTAAPGVAPATESPQSACADDSEYDSAAQHWYYMTKDSSGADVKMVRRWCPSEWVPQDKWYKFQRYIPRGNNNHPAPPIDDFDFLDSFARDEYTSSRKKMADFASNPTFDDWTLGKELGSPESGEPPSAAFDDNTSRTHAADLRFGPVTTPGKPRPAFDDNTLGNQAAGLDMAGGSPPLDAWNKGKLPCVGDECFDSNMQGGMHDNGVQPYDDYAHMNGLRGRRAPRARDVARSPEEAHVRALRREGKLAGEEEGQEKQRLLLKPRGP